MATRNLRPVRNGKDRPWLRLVVSFFSGACSGLFGINMFIVAYLQRTAKDYSEFKGSMCFLFLGENLFRLCTYAVSGILSRDALYVALCSVPAAALAMVLSNVLGPRLDEHKLQKGAIALFGAHDGDPVRVVVTGPAAALAEGQGTRLPGSR